MRIILCILALACSMAAQTVTRAAVITITDANNPPETVYTVYRAIGNCSVATPEAFVKLGASANKIYRDTAVAVGAYCYRATATLNGVEGEPSNSVAAIVGPMKFTISVSVEQTVASNP